MLKLLTASQSPNITHLIVACDKCAKTFRHSANLTMAVCPWCHTTTSIHFLRDAYTKEHSNDPSRTQARD